ncbi:hypothetical protein AQ611_00110 [Burkholderia singularis]|nr:hypothetical protein AQ611_00110 [Burkholderia sp. Bp7605]
MRPLASQARRLSGGKGAGNAGGRRQAQPAGTEAAECADAGIAANITSSRMPTDRSPARRRRRDVLTHPIAAHCGLRH